MWVRRVEAVHRAFVVFCLSVTCCAGAAGLAVSSRAPYINYYLARDWEEGFLMLEGDSRAV